MIQISATQATYVTMRIVDTDKTDQLTDIIDEILAYRSASGLPIQIIRHPGRDCRAAFVYQDVDQLYWDQSFKSTFQMNGFGETVSVKTTKHYKNLIGTDWEPRDINWH